MPGHFAARRLPAASPALDRTQNPRRRTFLAAPDGRKADPGTRADPKGLSAWPLGPGSPLRSVRGGKEGGSGRADVNFKSGHRLDKSFLDRPDISL